MARVLVLAILIPLLARIFWRMVDGFIQGMTGRDAQPGHPAARGQAPGHPPQGVHMVRDPVCGTFILPERAVTALDGPTRVFFCSNACRDKYRARTA